MTRLSESTSYYALRVCPQADADVWWSAVRRRDDIPSAIGALLGGRARIELTREEAGRALAWAGGVEGWPSTETRPLFVYPTNPVDELLSGEIA